MMRLSWDPSRFDVISLLFVLCEAVALPVFRVSFLEEIVAYVAVDAVCPWEGVSAGSSYIITRNDAGTSTGTLTSS